MVNCKVVCVHNRCSLSHSCVFLRLWWKLNHINEQRDRDDQTQTKAGEKSLPQQGTVCVHVCIIALLSMKMSLHENLIMTAGVCVCVCVCVFAVFIGNHLSLEIEMWTVL